MKKDLTSPINKDATLRIASWKAENKYDLGVLYHKVLDSLDREVFHLSTIPLDETEALEYFINEVRTRIKEAKEGVYNFVTDLDGKEIHRGYEIWEKVTEDDDD